MTTTSKLIRVQPSALAHGLADPKDVMGMTGMQFFTALAEGRFPPPPISKTLNFTLTEFEHGRAIFEGEPLREFYNPLGSIHGSYAAALLDSCMGCAVHTALPAGQAYTTLEYKISLVRGMTDKTGVVRAEGKVLQVGRRVATAEGWLTDSAGKLLAHGTTTCLVFEIPPAKP